MDCYSPNNWHADPAKALSADKLGQIERHLEKSGYIAVLHSHFCGAREPTPSAFGDFEQFKEYLASQPSLTVSGDREISHLRRLPVPYRS